MTTRLFMSGVLLLAAGCYSAQTVDPQTVLDELRAEERARAPKRAPAGDGSTALPAGGALTADEAVAMAMRRNPDLRAMRHEVGAAEGEMIDMTALKNPALEVQGLHLQDLAQKAWAVELSWDLPQVGVRPARRAAGTARIDAVKNEIAETELDVEMAVRAAHAIVLSIAEQRAILEQALVARRRIVELVEKRVGGGVATRLDLSLAQLGVADVERDRDDLSAKEIQAARALALLVGAQAPVRAAGELPPDEPPPTDLDALEASAMKVRPAVRRAKASYTEREQTVRAENARRWPELSLSARYRNNDTSRNPNDWSVGLQLTLPVLDQNRGKIRMAEETRSRELEQLRKVLTAIRREIAAAAEELALREATLKRYRNTVLPSLLSQEQLLAAATAGGQLDLVAVLRAQDAILKARREYCELRLAYHRARLALERATGHGNTEKHSGE